MGSPMGDLKAEAPEAAKMGQIKLLMGEVAESSTSLHRTQSRTSKELKRCWAPRHHSLPTSQINWDQ